MLIELNDGGFVTTHWQSGILDPKWPQCAYVDGFSSEEVAARVEAGLLGAALVVLSFAPGTWVRGSITVPVDDGAPYSFFGRHDPDGDLAFYANGSEELDAALAQAWVVQVFDPVWGRNDELWSKLTAALAVS